MISKSSQDPGLRARPTQLLAATVAATLLLAGSSARAQGRGAFGTKGQLAITAENLFAFSSEKFTQPGAAGDESQTSSRFGILFSSRGNDEVSVRGPMVGGHYFVIPSLSVGGSIGFESHGGSTSERGISVDRNTVSTFVLLPKVGYALVLNDTIGFWFRGGPGFSRMGVSGNGAGSSSAAVWTLGADALFVVTPVPHFGFYVGPQGEFSFAGSTNTTNANGVATSRDLSYQSLAISAGLLGYLGL